MAAVADAAAAPPSDDMDVDMELQRLYEQHNPAKLADLPQLKSKYGAAQLLAKARQKYEHQQPVTPPASPAHDAQTEAAMAEEAKLRTLLAAGAVRRTTTRAVRQRGALPLEDRPEDPLHGVVLRGDWAALRRLHEGPAGPADLAQPWSRRHPAIVIEAVHRGHAELLDYIIEAGAADLSIVTSTGRCGPGLEPGTPALVPAI
eukprot:SAG22_NODE_197_length_15520_cov_116.311264_13_plen_203_part_00